MLLTTAVANAVEPTIYEQYLLELINRGRLDPSAEAARYEMDLNEGLAPGTISTEPKQPLAFHPALIAAARGHSEWMLANDEFDHIGEGGSSPGDRMAAAGYVFRSPWSWGENIAWIGTVSPVDLTDYTADIHANLFASAGHRKNQMNSAFREAGLGVVQGPSDPEGFTFVDIYATENFALSGNSLFLTGVVYDDGAVSADAFYKPGEGLGGVTVEAIRDSDGQVFSTQTWAAGGYSLPVPSGTYTVRATGAALGESLVRSGIVVSTQNIKVDFTATQSAYVNLGAIDYRLVANLDLDADPLPFRIETSRAGTLTLLASDGNVALTLYDDTWTPLAQTSGRLDYDVAGPAAVYYAALSGQGMVNIALANLVHRDGARVHVFGTGGDDSFIFDASSTPWEVAVRGVSYWFTGPSEFFFDGLGGQNHVQFVGSSSDDRALLRPAQAALFGPGYTVAAVNIASSDFDGGGGQDAAFLYGSRRGNLLTAGGENAGADPQRTTLGSDGVSIAATAETIHAYGRGGKDTATLCAATAGDQFQPCWKDARMSGTGYTRELRGFAQVTVDIGPTITALPQANSSHDLAQIAGLMAWDQAKSRKDTTLEIKPVDQVFAYWR